jgi:cytochrome c-type biogenesis protein CcmH/NrfF
MRILFFAALLGLASAPAPAQTPLQVPPEVERTAREAMVQLRSPVTPSHTLDMCPADAAIALRDTVRMAALAGMSSAQIVDDVVARYGEPMRILPKRSGKGLVAWLLTPFALIGGALFVALRLRAMREHGPAPAAGDGPGISAEDEAALAEALRGLDAAEEEAAR